MRGTCIYYLSLILLAVFSQSCENEKIESDINDSAQLVTKQVVFSELDSKIQQLFNQNISIAKESSIKSKTGKDFGEIIEEKVNVSTQENGSTSYTLKMDKTDAGAYYDNMLIQVDSLGNTYSHILRYEPELEWYRYIKDDDRYSKYSGKISVFDPNGDSVVSLSIKDGQATKTTENSTTGRCVVTDTEYAGGCSDGCWISEITFHISCTNTTLPAIDPGLYSPDSGSEDPTLDAGESGGGGGAATNPIDGESADAYPKCSSFEFSPVGSGWQTAALTGVWDVAIKLGRCPGLAAASFSEPLYFQLPGFIPNDRASELSALLLWTAFEEWGNWYRTNYANDCVSEDLNPIIRETLLDYIKDEFSTVGGRVDRVPPLGYNGIPRPFETAGDFDDFTCE